MEEDELAISLSQWKQLKDYLVRIDQLFQVELCALNENSVSEDDRSRSAVRIRFSGARDHIEKAKSYVSSVVASDSDRTVQLREQSPESLQRLSAHVDHIERQSQAVLSVLERAVCVWGVHHNVSRACLLMEQLISTTGSKENEEPSLPNLTLSPSVDSNPDSCYDSDSSSVGSGGRTRAHRHDSDSHRDVSRTVSDTLASELTETESKPETDSYEAKVERYVKLGFSESKLRLVLGKLGGRPSDDDLLGELLSLTGLDDEDDDDDDVDEPVPQSVTVVPSTQDEPGLRPIVIDGSNVAMSHGNKEVFSCRGIQLAVDWFQSRGHQDITVFVPQWRKEASRPDAPITDQEILVSLEKQKRLVFTPARRINGKRVVCYDDRYVIKLAAENGGVVVSNDNYRDLMNENPEYRKVIEQRLLMYSFVNDRFMPPDDPLGRHGPSVDTFLQKDPRPANCPYANRCTFGNKCKFFHPERGAQPYKMMSEKLAESAKNKLKKKKQLGQSYSTSVVEKHGLGKDASPTKTPLSKTKSLVPVQKKQLARTKSLNPALTAPMPEQNKKSDNSAVEPSNQERLRRNNRTEVDSLPCPRKDRLSHSHDSLPVSKDTQIQKDLLPAPFSTHDTLRQIHSDPNRPEREQRIGDHVKISRNRSNESAIPDGNPAALTQKVFEQQMQEHSVPTGYDEKHAKLNRQLSLEGSHDPRLQYVNTGDRDMAAWSHSSAGPQAQRITERPSNSPHASLRAHQSASRTSSLAAQNMQIHAPLAKMDSAPASQHCASAGCDFAQHVPPLVKRQNSTSDPQLNLNTCPDMEAHNRWPNAYTQVMPNQIIVPLQNNGAFSSEQGIANIPHARVAFHPAPSHYPAHHHRQVNHYPNQSQGPFFRYDASQGLPMPIFNPPQDREPPLLIAPSERDSIPHNFTMHPVHPMGAMFQPGPFIPEVRNPPVLPTQQPDPSSQIFKNLCAIFPEDRVRRVMQEHPNETNPEVLCSHLVNKG